MSNALRLTVAAITVFFVAATGAHAQSALQVLDVNRGTASISRPVPVSDPPYLDDEPPRQVRPQVPALQTAPNSESDQATPPPQRRQQSRPDARAVRRNAYSRIFGMD